jgi:hypothetical protein
MWIIGGYFIQKSMCRAKPKSRKGEDVTEYEIATIVVDARYQLRTWLGPGSFDFFAPWRLCARFDLWRQKIRPRQFHQQSTQETKACAAIQTPAAIIMRQAKQNP